MTKRIISSILKKISLNLGEWNQDTRIVALEPKEFGIVHPVNINQIHKSYKNTFDLKVFTGQRSIYELNNVMISRNGIVFKNFRIFTPSLAEPWLKDTLSYTFLLNQFRNIPSISLENNVALVYDQWSMANYFHWMADTLPRLLVLRNNYRITSLIAPEILPAYAKITAAALGFTDWVPFDNIVKVDRLLLPEHTSPKGYQDAVLIKQVVQDILNYLGHTALEQPKKRLYVSRYKQSFRRLTNENEIDGLLLKYGFKKIFFEDYSFEQQVQLMLETSVLIGVHGANMTNIMFMQEGSKVVEIMNDKIFNSIYLSLSTCFQLPYFLLPATSTDGEANKPNKSSDLIIDPKELEKILEGL